MDINEIFGKEHAVGRRQYIVTILRHAGEKWTSRYLIASVLWDIYHDIDDIAAIPPFPIKREDFYKSHAARVITADIAAINAEPRNYCTIVHNGCGVKLQSRAEAEIWLKAQFRETLGKLNHLKDIARKNGLDGQAIMQSPDVISAYID